MASSKWHFVFALVGTLAATPAHYASAGEPLCPRPPPGLNNKLSINPMFVNVYGSAVSFSYKGHIFPMDIYSAYAARGAGATGQYCIRYEVTNRSDNSIDKFYWPVAGIQVDFFDSQQTISIATTRPGGVVPSLNETWIFAFLNGAAKTRAYQKETDNQHWLNEEKAQFGSAEPLIRLVAVEPQLQRFPQKPGQKSEGLKFSDIGADAASNDDSLSAISHAYWDGDSAEIGIELERSNDKVSVNAPVTYAFWKGFNDSASFIELVRQSSNQTIPFTGVNFKASTKILPRNFASTSGLYIIEQPITFTTGSRKICFLAPVYAPMPLPPELLSCRLVGSGQ
jgi:hypothetical protein